MSSQRVASPFATQSVLHSLKAERNTSEDRDMRDITEYSPRPRDGGAKQTRVFNINMRPKLD